MNFIVIQTVQFESAFTYLLASYNISLYWNKIGQIRRRDRGFIRLQILSFLCSFGESPCITKVLTCKFMIPTPVNTEMYSGIMRRNVVHE